MEEKILNAVSKSVQISFLDDKMLICGCTESDESQFNLKGDKTNIIYSAELVQKVINFWNLNFESKTSMTFGTHTVTEFNGKTFTVISR